MRARIGVVVVVLLAFALRAADLARYPSGVSSDEATSPVDAFNIAVGLNYPPYEDHGRPDPLYDPLLALTVPFFGAELFTFRLATVFIGLITVALSYRAAIEAFYDLPPTARTLAALAAAAALAVMLSHITLSRSLYRAVLQPPLMLAGWALLLRGLRTGRRATLIGGGAALALACYTYTAALVTPLAVAPFVLALMIFRRTAWRRWLPRLVIAGAAFLVVITPVALLIITEPDAVLARSADVSRQMPPLDERIQGLVNQLFTNGDPNPQYNVERAPLLPQMFVPLFAFGVVALLVRARVPSSWMIGALFVLATLPSLLADEIGHGLRIVGIYPALALIIAAGVAALASLMMQARVPVWIVGAALALITAREAVHAHTTYSGYWARPYTTIMHSRELGWFEWFFRHDSRDLAAWIKAQAARQDTPLLLPVETMADRTLRAHLLTAYPAVRAVGDLPALPPDTRVIVPDVLALGDLDRAARHYALLHDGTITILPPFDAATHAALVANIDAGEAIMGENGRLLARAVTIGSADVHAAPAHDPLPPARFGGEMQVAAWRGPETIAGGMDAIYTIEWQPTRRLGHFYSAFLHLMMHV